MLVVASALVFLLGLGLFASRPLRVFGPASDSSFPAQRCAADLATWLTLGLLLDLSLLLCLGSVRLALIVGGGASLTGLAIGLRDWIGRRTNAVARARTSAAGIAFWISLLVLVAILAMPILGTPIAEWDARSIWFFQARMIYHAGSLGRDAGFAAMPFGHPDYPKLLPSLAAQLAAARGFWNEYLPKGAMLLLLVPVLLGYFGFARRPLSFVFLLGMSWLRVGPKLWDGHADGPLALFGALGALALARWVSEDDARDGLLGIVCLGVCATLKNEGFFLALCVGLPVAAAWFLRRPRLGLGPWRSILLGVIVGLPFVIWEIDKRVWGLQSQYELSADSLQQFDERVAGDGLNDILAAFFTEQQLQLALLPWILALILAWVTRTRVPIAAWLPATSALLYAALLMAVYLGTQFDLPWQLQSSAGRTLLAPALALYAAGYFALDAIEKKWPWRSQSTQSA